MLPNGEKVDYVLFISGKESELDTVAGRTQRFLLQQFTDVITQYQEILVKSGIANPDELPDNEDGLLNWFDELFSSYNGLIVLDDIDALSRRGTDTGEEALFLKAATSAKRTRILYTLRYPAAHARRHSVPVTGLNQTEFCTFLDTCCEQFGVTPPPADQMVAISTTTSNLPLLIENVVGLRKYCSSWRQALDQFNEKGGDEARRYLYQREYDRLLDTGRARELLAALAYVPMPLSFSTLAHLFSFSDEQVRDALSECTGIFLTTETGESGDTLYTVTPSSRSFITSVSDKLTRAELIRRKVELLVREGARYTPSEAAVIVRLEQLCKRSAYVDAIEIADTIPINDPVLANPKVLALIGEACANLENGDRVRARKCFKAAEALKYRDVKMMRSWFHLERRSGYGLEEAKRIASGMIESKSSAARVRSEFLSKLGDCYFAEARSFVNVSSEKTLHHFRCSIYCYAEAVRVGAADGSYDLSKTLDWLENVVSAYARFAYDKIDDYLDCIGALEPGSDLDPRVAEIIALGVIKLQIRIDEKSRARVSGVLTKSIGKLNKMIKSPKITPGWIKLRDMLDTFRERLKVDARNKRISPE